jgi:hypothetical protein
MEIFNLVRFFYRIFAYFGRIFGLGRDAKFKVRKIYMKNRIKITLKPRKVYKINGNIITNIRIDRFFVPQIKTFRTRL